MERYEKYKDSGFDWIGEIPEHWKSIRLKYIGYLYGGLSGKSSKDFNQSSNPDNKPFIPFTNIANNKVIDPNQLQYVVIKEDEKQNQVEKGDLFFMMSSENYEDVGKSTILLDDLGEAYLNSFCKGFRFTEQEYFPTFINYLLLSQPYRSLLQIEANGFTRINLKIDKVNDLSLKVPPFKEQTAIADYLDRKTAEIDELISQKEQLLKLYEEEKTVIINQAVTKGLPCKDARTCVSFKDSGIDWLGEIPEHWEVKKIKYISDLRSGNNLTSSQIKLSDDFPVYGGNGLRGYYSEFTHNGDFVLIGRQGALCGNINYAKGKFWATEHAVVATPKVEYEIIWFGELLRIMNLNQYSVAAAQPGLAVDTIRNLTIPVPLFEEQTTIVKHIETEINRKNNKAEKTKKLIDLLSEYKQSLISEVVTGKIKVI